ncbi:cell wall-binding repeat-containing protein, partial [Micrococcus sp. SIMBA_144]
AAVAGKLSSDQVAVVNGKGFADALSVAAYAARNHMPILLTETNKIPDATKKALDKYDRSLAVGGSGVISEDIFDELPDSER